MITDNDRGYLERCVELAAEALEKGNSPFGSILVSKDGEILFEDHNRDAEGDNTRHPEFEIAKWAVNNLSEDERKCCIYFRRTLFDVCFCPRSRRSRENRLCEFRQAVKRVAERFGTGIWFVKRTIHH